MCLVSSIPCSSGRYCSGGFANASAAHGDEDAQALLAAAYHAAGLAPGTKSSDLRRVWPLSKDQRDIPPARAVEPGLHIEVAPERVAVLDLEDGVLQALRGFVQRRWE